MTIERKIVVGLEDIQEARLKCEVDGCNERVAILTNRGDIPACCRQGHQWKTISDPALKTLLVALAEPKRMQEIAKKAGFSVLLEFGEPAK